ncbi:MAG: hypothetical protein ACREIK_00670 [Nitrospiraceae bacterium]
MRTIPYEVTTTIEGSEEDDDDEEEKLLGPKVTMGHNGKALSLNICSGGMLLLMEGAPRMESVVKLHVPTPVLTARTPTLAEVRWVRKVPFEEGGSQDLHFVGMKFIL